MWRWSRHTAPSKYRAIWRVLSRSTLITTEPPSGKRSSESCLPASSSSTSVHVVRTQQTQARAIPRPLADSLGSTEQSEGKPASGEKVARRQRQAYRCQSVNWKSLTAPPPYRGPSRILHFLPESVPRPTRAFSPFAELSRRAFQRRPSLFFCLPLFARARAHTALLFHDGGASSRPAQGERCYTANQFTAGIRRTGPSLVPREGGL